MKDHVTRLLAECPDAKPEYFERSGWFENPTAAEIREATKTYEKHYERRLAELIDLLGRPDQDERKDRSAIERWYPEALRAACWIKDGKTLCLALEHHDKETPVAVLLRCLTASEIEELSE